MTDERTVRLVTVVVLGLVLMLAVVGLTFVALRTDRDLVRGATLMFAAVIVLAALGSGLVWAHRRRTWHVNVNHDDNPELEGD